MKTIFITVYDGMISKNILRSGIFAALKKHECFDIVLIVDPSKKDVFEKEFKDARVHVDAPSQFHYSGIERVWARFLSQVPRTRSVKNFIEGSPVTPRKSFFKRKFQLLLREIFDHGFFRALFRKIDEMLFDGRQLAYLFEKYEPALIFAANVYGPADVWALKQAQRRGVLNIGMVKSWDNLTTRGLFRVHSERLIVHNYQLKEQAVEIDDYPEGRIFVSGTPHYDIFFGHRDLYTRENFWKKYNIDPNKKIILYCEPGTNTAHYGHEIWRMIDGFFKSGEIRFPAEMFVTIHPAFSAKEEILRELNFKFVRLGEFTGANYKSWELPGADMFELMCLIKFSDLVINTGSTMNIEAAILDKPIINIAFDGFRKRDYRESVRQYYDQEHLLNIIKTGGVRVARDKEELLEQINELLANPSIGREGSRKIVEEQCVFKDGGSSERIANYILRFFDKEPAESNINL